MVSGAPQLMAVGNEWGPGCASAPHDLDTCLKGARCSKGGLQAWRTKPTVVQQLLVQTPCTKSVVHAMHLQTLGLHPSRTDRIMSVSLLYLWLVESVSASRRGGCCTLQSAAAATTHLRAVGILCH